MNPVFADRSRESDLSRVYIQPTAPIANHDAGWNQSNYQGMQTVAEKIPQVKLQYVDKVNPGDRPKKSGF